MVKTLLLKVFQMNVSIKTSAITGCDEYSPYLTLPQKTRDVSTTLCPPPLRPMGFCHRYILWIVCACDLDLSSSDPKIKRFPLCHRMDVLTKFKEGRSRRYRVTAFTLKGYRQTDQPV